MTANTRQPWFTWVVAAWLGGVALLSLRLLLGWTQVRRLARRGTEPPELWQARIGEFSRLLGIAVPVRFRVTRYVQVPAVIGWLRPILLVPAAALADLAPQQLEALLLHELAHIRRHDYAVNLLQTFVETLLFYHPATGG